MTTERIKDACVERSIALREAEKRVTAANNELKVAQDQRQQILRKWSEIVDIAARVEL